MKNRGFIPLLAATALAVTACSSGDEASNTTPAPTIAPAVTQPDPATTTAPTTPPSTTPSTTTSSTTTTPPTSPPTTLSPAQVDQELARTALLTLDAFPTGWTAAPPEDDDEPDEAAAYEAEFDACLAQDGVRVIEPFEELEVASDTFSADSPNQPEVEHEVLVLADEATALAAMAEVAAEGAAGCIEPILDTFFQESLLDDPDTPEGLAIGDVTVERADAGTSPDLAVGYIIAVPFEIGDEAATQYLHVWYQRDGRALSNLQLSSFGEPFDPLGIDSLTGVVQENLATIGS